ncbi:MAG TPA: TraR/DksA family transcriptional regulator [Burkholderiales bacterium]|nr:TraR/DksA family transcriptional regulator [Burkholderiales bacterium]
MLMLDDTEIREIEDGLQKRRSQLIEEISEKLRAARDPTSSEQADELIEVGDAAIADLLTHTSLAESQRDVQELQEIEAALARITDGSFGVCAQCGKEIEAARLQAHPTALRCIHCQEEYERTHAGPATPTL